MSGTGARQICQELRDQILGGTLSPGDSLPSSRALAAELGVSRTTVTTAYDQLLAEGYIEVRQGARPRVIASAMLPDAPRKPLANAPSALSAFGRRMAAIPSWPEYRREGLAVDFRHGDVAAADFPTALWRKAVSNAAMQRPERLSYQDPRGTVRLRRALQGYLWRARMLHCDLDQIIVVNGSQQGLDLCARLLLDPTDSFAIENPCYPMARNVFAATGAREVPLSVDRDGLMTETLEGVSARLVYLTPSHQFPLGGVMPMLRRSRVLDWAATQGAYVIEDDYDGEYRYDLDPVPPLHKLDDNGRVIYLGTVSKTLSPTLRLGYMVVPRDLSDAFAAAKRLTDRHAPALEQDALASLIESGVYEAHIRRIRRHHNDRRSALIAALQWHFGPKLRIEGEAAGLHLVAWFPHIPHEREAALIRVAHARGLGLHSIAPHYSAIGQPRPAMPGLVMGYSALSLRQIETGIGMLASVLEAGPWD